jgi:hypothetical protein
MDIVAQLEKESTVETNSARAELLRKAIAEIQELRKAIGRGDDVMRDAIGDAIARERETCAKIVEQSQGDVIAYTQEAQGAVAVVHLIAARIRAARPLGS